MAFLKNLSEAKGWEEIVKALDTFNDTEVILKNIKTRNLKDARIKLQEKKEMKMEKELNKKEI